jgi:hypothetical protein
MGNESMLVKIQTAFGRTGTNSSKMTKPVGSVCGSQRKRTIGEMASARRDVREFPGLRTPAAARSSRYPAPSELAYVAVPDLRFQQCDFTTLSQLAALPFF